MTMIIDGSLGTTFPDSSLQPAAASPYTLKNKIINGAMVIDQRNAGASVTLTSGSPKTFPVDRFLGYESNASAIMTGQQSSTAPTGFSNSLLFTTTTSSAVLAADYTQCRQNIEGYNVSDLNFGTANAQTITLSFWVRGSITGTYGLAFTNGAEDRSRLTSYTINAANTWEQKTITITGDTSGTWLTTNGTGLIVIWDLGGGSNNGGTVTGSWVAGVAQNLTGGVKLQANTGATLYITGVQLEIGTSATPFERRLYGQELANCQRYCQQWTGYGTSTQAIIAMGMQTSTTGSVFNVQSAVPMRAAPTVTFSSLIVSNSIDFDAAASVVGIDKYSSTSSYVGVTHASAGAATRPVRLSPASGSSGFFNFSAEL
jgi:hypothetical protein